MSSEIYSGYKSVVGYPEMPVNPLKHPEQQREVLILSPRQIQIFEFKAMGLGSKAIARELGASPQTINNTVYEYVRISGLTPIFAISGLIESNPDSRERIASSLNLERYTLLTKRQREILDYIAEPRTWNDTRFILAQALDIREYTFRNHLAAISKKLELDGSRILLRARVFMLLLKTQEAGKVEDTAQSSNPETFKVEGAFSQQLKSYRERLGLTQRKLAEKTGLDHSGISRLERGEREPTMSTAFALVRGLGLDSEQTKGFFEAVYEDHKKKLPTAQTT